MRAPPQPRHGVLFVLPPGCSGEGSKMLLCACNEVQGPFRRWSDACLCPECRGEFEQGDFIKEREQCKTQS